MIRARPVSPDFDQYQQEAETLDCSVYMLKKNWFMLTADAELPRYVLR